MYVYFHPTAVSNGDKILAWYYSLYPPSEESDYIAAPPLTEYAIDGLCKGLDSLDRVDFGNHQFPWGTSASGEPGNTSSQYFKYWYRLGWSRYAESDFTDGTQERPDHIHNPVIHDRWTTIFRTSDVPGSRVGFFLPQFYDVDKNTGVGPFFVSHMKFVTRNHSINPSTNVTQYSPYEFRININGEGTCVGQDGGNMKHQASWVTSTYFDPMAEQCKTYLNGTHTGTNNSATLTDDKVNFFHLGARTGQTLYNKTDGSSTTITAVAKDTLTGVLAGGAENDWDTGDEWYLPSTVRVFTWYPGMVRAYDVEVQARMVGRETYFEHNGSPYKLNEDRTWQFVIGGWSYREPL